MIALAAVLALSAQNLTVPTLGSVGDFIAVVTAWTLVAIIGLLGLAVLWEILRGKIKLSDLLREAGAESGTASLAKFQFLIFTFVISLSIFVITIQQGAFPDIDPSILVLLGLSGGVSLTSSGISSARILRMEELRVEESREKNRLEELKETNRLEELRETHRHLEAIQGVRQ